MDTLPDKIRVKLKGFVFRRVSLLTPQQLYQTRYYTNPETYTKITDWTSLSKKEVERNVEFRYHNYWGWSSRTPLRSNDDFLGSPIFFERKTFGRFDPILLAIVADSTPARDVPPREGDLVCGIVKTDARGKLFYSQWFICSEQFYRAWTLVMYDSHSSFAKAEKKKCGAKTYWMSGNRLMTNNYLKWVLGLKEKGLAPTTDDQKTRYWHQRCEKTARTWIHVYCALVLLIRYRELPEASNVPIVRGTDTHSYPHWHLPSHFISAFVEAHE